MTISILRTLAPAFLLIAAVTAAGCSQDPEEAKQEAFTRGNGFFEKAQYSEASIEYRRAIQLDARFGAARKQLAETYLRLNDAPNAFREMVRAADLLPEDLDLQVRTGTFLLTLGQYEDARARADQVLAREPGRAEAHVLRGNALARLRDFEGALADMEQAVAAEPGSSLMLTNLGVVQHLRGEKVKAEEAFAEALKLDPESVMVRLSYANYLMVTRRLAEAEQQLKDAAQREPANALVNRALAAYYTSVGRAPEAEPYLKRLAADDKDPSAKFALAYLYLATERTAEAGRLLAQLAGQKETYLDATLLQVRLAYGTGDAARAHTLLNEALERSASDPRALLTKAQILMLDKKPAEAVEAAKAAVAANPALAEGYVVLGDAYRSLRNLSEATTAFNEAARLRPNDPRVQVALSQLHLATGGVELAKQFAERAARNAPDALAARKAVVRAALASGELARADAELAPLLTKNPADADLHVLDGARRMLRKDLSGAERAFQKALEHAPGLHAAEAGLVTLELATGRTAAARLRIDRIVERDGANVDTLLLAARTYGSLNDQAKLEQSLRRAVQADPSRSEPYALLGQLYVAQNKLEQALTEFRTLAERQPQSVGAHTMIGMILQMQNRQSEAKDAYRKTLSVDRRAAVAANNLAWMMLEGNENLDEALQLAQTAQAELPESADVADTLGSIYYKKGMFPQAIAALENAVRRQPANAGFQYHLGLAYAKNRDYKLTRQTLETALKLDPKLPEASEARDVLSQLARIGS